MGPTIMTISTISIATRHYIIPPTLSLSLFSLSPFSLKNRFYYCLSFLLILSYLLLLSIYSPYFLGAFVYVMEPSLGLLGGGGGGGGKEAELELGLGLSLGNGGGAAEKEKGKSCAWGEYGRILTAKDFPNGFACGRAAGGGTKRERGAADATDEGSASAAVGQVVGWPPIRSYRMNTLFNHAKASNAVEEKGVGEDESSKKKINHGGDKHDAAMAIKERGHLGFVKVNMDGLPIGRKVDLNAHKSYQTLANALEEMFFNPSLSTRGGKEQAVQPLKLLDGSSEFVLTYEDKEGDWMLVGDVPWGMFLNTVKRLRIMRTSEANGLAPKSQERNEKQKSKLI